ncbi:MAG: UDP-3-O-(3-hydroxymyristoyl)glucosamine N-acyltransferase [Planctomycetota bacterium]
MSKSLTVAEIAEQVGGTLERGGDLVIRGVESLEGAREGDISFLSEVRNRKQLADCKATALLLPPVVDAPDCGVIRIKDTQTAIAKVIGLLELEVRDHPFVGIHERAYIDPAAELGDNVGVGPYATICAGAKIGSDCVIYPGAFIGRDAVLGDRTVLFPNASVMRGCNVGNDVTLHPGAIVGAEGFGFHPTAEGLVRIPQLGTVVVEDGVSIGAHTTVDRARFGATYVLRGTALDNLIMLGHNVSVGPHTIIIAQTGVAGGTKIGAHCVVAGQVGIVGHVEIGDGIMIGAKSGVARSFHGVRAISGYYATEHREMKRFLAAQRKVPELIERVKELEKRLS